MYKTLIYIVILLVVSSFAVWAQQKPRLAERHIQQQKMKCADCHGAEKPTENASGEVCESCHGKLGEFGKDSKLYPNPHINHADNIYCTDCHSGHSSPVVYCNECHEFDFKVP